MGAEGRLGGAGHLDATDRSFFPSLSYLAFPALTCLALPAPSPLAPTPAASSAYSALRSPPPLLYSTHHQASRSRQSRPSWLSPHTHTHSKASTFISLRLRPSNLTTRRSGSSFHPSRCRPPDPFLVDHFPRLAQDGRQELGCSCLARAIQWQGSPFLGPPCL